MTPHSITYLPVFRENPGNPGRCEVATGQIEINQQAMSVLPGYQQEYVLEHEKGHYYEQTFDEVKADAYALRQMALKKPNSLWHHVLAVRNVSHNDPRRVRAAEKAALEIAAKDGSREAQELLHSYYANADGGYLLDLVDYGHIDFPITLDLKWYHFAWAAVIVVTICLLLTKFYKQ